MEAFLRAYTEDAYPFMSANGRDGLAEFQFAGPGVQRFEVPSLLDLVFKRDVVRMLVSKEGSGEYEEIYPAPSESEKRNIAARALRSVYEGSDL